MPQIFSEGAQEDKGEIARLVSHLLIYRPTEGAKTTPEIELSREIELKFSRDYLFWSVHHFCLDRQSLPASNQLLFHLAILCGSYRDCGFSQDDSRPQGYG